MSDESLVKVEKLLTARFSGSSSEKETNANPFGCRVIGSFGI